MKKLLIIPIAAALVGAAGLAVASDDDKGKRLGVNVPREQWMSIAQVSEQLANQGYKVRKIEADDGVYEVDVTDRNGVRLEVYVHPATGALLGREDD